MRLALVLLLVACGLPGCTVLGAGVAADLNRQHRAEAEVSLADSTLAVGDSLVLHLVDGSTLWSAFVSLQPDSVRLDAGTFALADVDHAERPWQQTRVGRGAAVGGGVDLAVFALLLLSLSRFPIGGGWTF